ncbi:NADAR family protein, partial [Streptomyces flavofungini]|uniref:NADAR family protein n=1 Tax=Streptomyces flavofungini TaxID=68200 RepID=UPI0034DDF633
MTKIGSVRSVATLLDAVRSGERVRYLPFWGHTPRRDGTLDRSCLSQWWPSPFTVDGVSYATAEHWMMAAKARLFDDAEAERAVLAARTPAEAKKAGRLVRGFDGAVWERERFAVVVEGSAHKFASDPALGEFLRGTGRRVLV